MRIKVRIIFFSFLFCLSALAEDEQFEIGMYINGISQTGNVLIKDGDLWEMFLYDKHNNKEIKKYNFYNPNNIFILEEDNFQNINEFINTEYEEIDSEIIEYYDIENWLKRFDKIKKG